MQNLGQNCLCTRDISLKIRYHVFSKMYPLREPWKLLAWRQLSVNKLFDITSKHADCVPQYQGFGGLQIAWFQPHTDPEFPCQCRVL